MASLAVGTWLRFLAWLAIGLVIYFAYGRRHSNLAPGNLVATGYGRRHDLAADTDAKGAPTLD